MQRTVRDIMNRELFSARAEEKTEPTLEAALEHGVTAVPILDAGHRPLGVVTVRDLARKDGRRHMSSPAATILEDATIVEAGRALTAANVNELVVIDEAGRATGTISALAIVRGLLGRSLRRPSTFPLRDDRFGLAWSSDRPLVAAGAPDVPDAPGVLVIFLGPSQRDASMRWAESCTSLRDRFQEMTETPAGTQPELRRILASGDLLYSFALVFEPDRRDQVAAELNDLATS